MFRFLKIVRFYSKMVNTGRVFVQRYNPRTGKIETIAVDENYDYSQQIAHSAYNDMLHDKERNEKYNTALKIAIEKVHRNNKKAIVLDIGTGTGLLSLFAERNGADEVYACESFKPMAKCAAKVIEFNNDRSKIKVIPKRSDKLTIGENGDLPHKVNILVTEVFDTELLGEGAINTFNHAHSYLLEEDAIVIPDSVNVSALVFESDLVNKWHKIQDISVAGVKPCTIQIPEVITNCVGSTLPHNVHLSQLSIASFKQITSPQVVFSFDFSKAQIIEEEQRCERLKCLTDGIAHGVFMWWELSLLKEVSLVISCAPTWAKDCADLSWRAHWKQAIYYLPCAENVRKHEYINLIVGHDKHSWYFKTSKEEGKIEEIVYNDSCRCSIHYCSRSRIGMFNDQNRWSKYEKVLSPVVDSDTICVCLSENTLLGVYAGLLGAKEVYQLDTGKTVDRGLKLIVESNDLKSKIKWAHTTQELLNMVNRTQFIKPLVIADPYFEGSSLPMHDLAAFYGWYEFDYFLTECVIPRQAKLCILPVHFDRLWKIRAPVENVLGIRLKPFDELVQNAIKYCPEQMDSQSLWEYPCVALSQPTACMVFDFLRKTSSKNICEKGMLPFEMDHSCNAIVAWVDWVFNEHSDVVISSGPTESVTVGEYVKWDMYSKQGVYFIYPAWNVTRQSYLHYTVNFHPEVGSFDYQFSVNP